MRDLPALPSRARSALADIFLVRVLILFLLYREVRRTFLYNKRIPPCNRTEYKISFNHLLHLRTPALHLIRAPHNAGNATNSTRLYVHRLLSTCNSGVIFICILLVSASHHHRLSWTFIYKLLSPSQYLRFLFNYVPKLYNLI